MARQRLSNAGAKRREEKIAKLAKQFNAEYSDISVSIETAFNLFLCEQKTKGNSAPTIAAYQRMYDKVLIPLLDIIAAGKDTFCNILERDDFQSNLMSYIQGELPPPPSVGETPTHFNPYWEKQVGVQTLNHYLRSYRTFGNFCLAQGYILFFQCYIKDIEPPVKEVYTEKELKKLLVKPDINDFTECRNYTIISLLLATGARCNTILNLQIKDFDLRNGVIYFNTLKNKSTEIIPLHPQTRKDISEFLHRWRIGATPNAPLFINEYGEKLTRSGLNKAIAHYNKSRGVTKTSIHLFRHTFAKNWIQSNGDIISLSKMLTHSDLTMVKRYSNLYSTDLVEKAETFSPMANIKRNSGTSLRKKIV
jgi:integrase/recombinase XerD